MDQVVMDFDNSFTVDAWHYKVLANLPQYSPDSLFANRKFVPGVDPCWYCPSPHDGEVFAMKATPEYKDGRWSVSGATDFFPIAAEAQAYGEMCKENGIDPFIQPARCW